MFLSGDEFSHCISASYQQAKTILLDIVLKKFFKLKIKKTPKSFKSKTVLKILSNVTVSTGMRRGTQVPQELFLKKEATLIIPEHL